MRQFPSIWGTGIAALQYSRRVEMRWAALPPVAGAGFAGSLAGAWAVTVVSPQFLRKLLPFVLDPASPVLCALINL